ncbi:MAG: hypothetical protein LRZ84_15235 [Desertifilum sp.]|nr:hypothetical protein [Desertifilum sp.]
MQLRRHQKQYNIGTLGYMAPEQSLGKANLSTDLYGLGATLLFLLTRKSPSQCYRYSIKVSSLNRIRGGLRLVHFIEKTLELKIKNRFESASAALVALNSTYNLKTFSVPIKFNSKDTSMSLIQTLEELITENLAIGLRTLASRVAFIPFVLFSCPPHALLILFRIAFGMIFLFLEIRNLGFAADLVWVEKIFWFFYFNPIFRYFRLFLLILLIFWAVWEIHDFLKIVRAEEINKNS